MELGKGLQMYIVQMHMNLVEQVQCEFNCNCHRRPLIWYFSLVYVKNIQMTSDV